LNGAWGNDMEILAAFMLGFIFGIFAVILIFMGNEK
jgi:hypothetical protein